MNIEMDNVHLFFGPPDMNEEATTILREAIVTSLTNEEFKEEAKKVLTFAPTPGDYEAATAAIERSSQMSPEVYEYIKAYVAKNSN